MKPGRGVTKGGVPTTTALIGLLDGLLAATGADPRLDRLIAETLGGTDSRDSRIDYTSSVRRCLDLFARCLPGWTWHSGYGVTGVFPYAAVSRGSLRFEASAPTVPLALLVAMVRALSAGDAAVG